MKTLITFFFLLFYFPLNGLSAEFSLNRIPSSDDSSQNTISESYPILKPLKGGPLKILFIGPVNTTGFISSEVSSRLDSECTEVFTGTRERPGFIRNGEFFSPEFSDSSASFKILASLGKDIDVIMLDFVADKLPSDIISAIRQKIAEGSGLVCIGSTDDYRILKIKRASKGKVLNVRTFYGSELFTTGKIGKGKVIIMPRFSQFTSKREQGNRFNNLANLIFYSTGKTFGTQLLGNELPSKPVEHEVIGISNYMIHIISTVPVDSMKITARYRNERGEKTAEVSHKYIIKKGRSFVLMDYPQLPMGKYSVDVTAYDTDGAIAFAGNYFEIDTNDKITDVRLWNTSAPVGGFFAGTISSSFEFKEGIVVTAELEDYWGRSIDKYTLETVTGRKKVDFIFMVKEPCSKLMTLKVKLYKNNELVSLIVKEFFVERVNRIGDFYLGILDTPLPSFIDSNEYHLLREAGTDIVAPDFSGIIDPSLSVEIVKGISKGNMDFLPVLASLSGGAKVNISGYDRINSLVDTLKNIFPNAYGFIIKSNKSNEGNTLQSSIDSLRSIIATIDSGAVFGTFDFSDILPPANDKLKISKNLPVYTTDNTIGEPGKNNNIKSDVFGNNLKGLVLPYNYASVKDESFLRRIPWFALFNGYNSVWFEGLYGGPGDALTPRLSLSPSYSALAEECGIIKRGIDRIILKSSLSNGSISPIIESDPLNGDKAGENIEQNDIKVVVYSDRGAYYVTIIPGLIGKAGGTNLGNYVLKLNNLDKSYFVYDVLGERFSGAVNKIYIDFSKNSAGLFALLPYRIRSLELSIANSIVNAGGKLNYSFRIIPQEESAKPVRHVALIELRDPSGKLMPLFSTEAESSDWTYEGVLPLTINEGPGRWILRVTDVISGKKAERAFVIRPDDMVK